MPEETKKPVAEETRPPNIKEVLGGFPGAPQQSQLDEWKTQYGNIFVTAFSEEEIFVFRPIDRATWTKLQRSFAEAGGTADAEAETVKAVMLFSSLAPEVLEQKAGTFSSLYNTIMEHSNFIPPQFASALTVRL